jgi:VanZ family protein
MADGPRADVIARCHAMRKSLLRPYLLNALFGWLPLFGWMALIFWLSHQPALPRPNREIGLPDRIFDLSAHASVFAILTMLAWWALVTWPADVPALFRRAPMLTAGVFAAVYAASDEIHQLFIPGRYASVVDWLVDLAGIAAAMAALTIGQRVFARRGARRNTTGR